MVFNANQSTKEGGISFKGRLKLSFNLKHVEFYASWINIRANSLMALKLTTSQIFTRVQLCWEKEMNFGATRVQVFYMVTFNKFFFIFGDVFLLLITSPIGCCWCVGAIVQEGLCLSDLGEERSTDTICSFNSSSSHPSIHFSFILLLKYAYMRLSEKHGLCVFIFSEGLNNSQVPEPT